jgi:membrane-bound serine protease (ClpP class)
MGGVEIVYVIAALGVALLLVELMLPTGGVLAVIGAGGLIAAGIVALGEEGEAADYIGPGLITLGVLSLVTFFVVTPKIIRAHQDQAKTGWEELMGREAEVRSPLNPVGQIWIEGSLWKARVPDGAPEVGVGNRVRVESVDGLTLVVKPVSQTGKTV